MAAEIINGAIKLAGCLLRGQWLKETDDRPRKPFPIPADFFGICVAAPADPAGDDYVIARLHELGVRHVRLDLTYTEEAPQQTRLLQKLLEARLRVCLHPVLPRAAARQMGGDAAALRHWQDFLEMVLQRWGQAVESVELGATCNRRKWSGQSLFDFLRFWEVSAALVRKHGVRLLGPNVTDFEPVYNFVLLDWMRRHHCLPDVQTDNLFVERATEPESFDHKIIGRRCAGLLRFNLIRKAQLLRRIGAWHGVDALYCSHVSWSRRRIARLLEAVEEKQADYLARYFLLAAASGVLQRVYWGPLIGQREGLIDDNTDFYPDPPHVTFYGLAPGRPDDYRCRPAFYTLAGLVRQLSNAVFTRACTDGTDLEILEFKKPTGAVLHAVWTRNGQCASAIDCYTEAALNTAIVYDCQGRKQEKPPAIFGESPCFLEWSNPAQAAVMDRPAATAWRLAAHNGQMPQIFKTADQEGICQSVWNGENIARERLLTLPDTASVAPGAALRMARNQVWRQVFFADPHAPSIIIKQFKIPGALRRLLDLGKAPKAKRSWDNAQELLRRGIATPMPLACILSRRRGQPDYYLCPDYQPDCSVRDIFTTFAEGPSGFAGTAETEWYEIIAGFLRKMHARGVFFGDLSAGNLLAKRAASGKWQLALIDTARVRFYSQALGTYTRLRDLMRICHPLHWTGRRQFLAVYFACQPPWWVYLPLWLYDLKHALKKAIRPLRRCFRRTK